MEGFGSQDSCCHGSFI